MFFIIIYATVSAAAYFAATVQEQVDGIFFLAAVGVVVTVWKLEPESHFSTPHINIVLFEGRGVKCIHPFADTCGWCAYPFLQAFYFRIRMSGSPQGLRFIEADHEVLRIEYILGAANA